MQVIAVVAQKGGTGKSTVSSNLAVAAHREGLRTLVIDCDPQRSLMDWSRARGGAPPQAMPLKASMLPIQVESIRRTGLDVLVIDTRGSDPVAAIDACKAADLTLVVVRPTAADLRAIARTVEALKPLRRSLEFVINQAPSQRGGAEPALVAEAMRLLLAYRIAPAPVALRSRLAFQTAFAAGAGVIETEPRGQAAREVLALWAHVRGVLAHESGRGGP